jgi:hypothetical protein
VTGYLFPLAILAALVFYAIGQRPGAPKNGEPAICAHYMPPLCPEDSIIWKKTPAGCLAPFCSEKTQASITPE